MKTIKMTVHHGNDRNSITGTGETLADAIKQLHTQPLGSYAIDETREGYPIIMRELETDGRASWGWGDYEVTEDRDTGGDTAPASPAHTAEIAAIPGADETLLREVLEDAFATDTETEDQLCTLVTSLFSHTETQRAEIKALRDAIGGLLRYCVTVDGMPNKDEGRTAEQQGAYDAARAALKGVA